MAKPSFASAMKKQAVPPPETAVAEAVRLADMPDTKNASTSSRPPSREGKAPVTAFIDKADLKQLKLLTVELETSQQDVIIAALSDYFEKHGKTPLQR